MPNRRIINIIGTGSNRVKGERARRSHLATLGAGVSPHIRNKLLPHGDLTGGRRNPHRGGRPETNEMKAIRNDNNVLGG
jgi:hypothetical protein